MQNLKEQSSKKSKKLANGLQYSGMAMQMGITIGIFVFIGLKLDLWLETKVVFTLILSLFGVAAALYYFIKKAIADNDN
ncbi:MAG: AtpZ/AtpI family protein [Saprospiraceae bacterium]|nr:AtpZ/AtpI family protein [Saprospiraceae bacterium]